MTNYEDAAREVDELKDSGREFQGLTPVKAKVSPTPRAVVSFRVLPSELERITRAAEERGISVSDFLRSAALAATESPDDDQRGQRVQTIEELRSKAIDLAEVARRL